MTIEKGQIWRTKAYSPIGPKRVIRLLSTPPVNSNTFVDVENLESGRRWEMRVSTLATVYEPVADALKGGGGNDAR